MNYSTLKGQFIRKYMTLFTKKHVTSLYYPIEHTIKVHAIAHRFTYYYVNLDIKILPR